MMPVLVSDAGAERSQMLRGTSVAVSGAVALRCPGPRHALQLLELSLHLIGLIQDHRIVAMRIALGGAQAVGADPLAHRRIVRVIERLVRQAARGGEAAAAECRRIDDIRRKWRILAAACGHEDRHRSWAHHEFLLTDLHRHARLIAAGLEAEFPRESSSGRLLECCVFSLGRLTEHLQALAAVMATIAPGSRCTSDVLLQALGLLTEAEVDLERLAAENRAIRSSGPAFAVSVKEIAPVLREIREQLVTGATGPVTRAGALGRLGAFVEDVRERVFDSLELLCERAG